MLTQPVICKKINLAPFPAENSDDSPAKNEKHDGKKRLADASCVPHASSYLFEAFMKAAILSEREKSRI